MIASRRGALFKVTSSRFLAFGLALALGWAAPAAAQKEGKDDARRFFNAGQKAFQAGRYVEAAKAFEEAFRLKPHPFPMINAGDAWEKAGELALAARSYQKVLVFEQSTEQDRSDATERLAKLSPKVGIIELEGDPSMRARVDEDEFKGGDRVYVVPGEHVVSLLDVDSAKDKKVDVAAGASRTVTLASLKPGAQGDADTTGSDASTSGTPDPSQDQVPTKKGGIRATTWLMFGLTAVGAGGAVYFGLQVNDAEKKYNDAPNQDEYDRFNQNKLLTNVSLGVAVLSAGIGTVLLIGDLKRKEPAPAPDARLRPRVTVGAAPLPGGGALFGSGHF